MPAVIDILMVAIAFILIAIAAFMKAIRTRNWQEAFKGLAILFSAFAYLYFIHLATEWQLPHAWATSPYTIFLFFVTACFILPVASVGSRNEWRAYKQARPNTRQ